MKTVRFFSLIVIAATGPVMAQGNMSEMLAKADSNHDGAVSRAELIRSRATIFARMDVDRNGMITSDDVSKWSYVLGEATANAQWARVRATADANKNGKVSRDEFVKGPTPGFDALDTNHDNVVSAAELAVAGKAGR
jgi:EF hand